MPASSSLPQFEDHARQTRKHTTCYMCACRCGVRVTLENNKIRYIQGNPNHPVNRGVLCGKGNAAIMKQYSPAKLRSPMMRAPGAERGSGEFVAISWDEALRVLTERLRRIRATDPNRLAFFTGRDQMQALSGLWAQQFGTLNWAAHGGFCSVNMAAAGLLTTHFSFWEFGEPDWDHAEIFLLWGVAEDHASNPIKIGLKKLKERGAKIVAINPVRTGYQAIADEWIAINPGSDAMLILSLVHELLTHRRIDDEFLTRYTNMPCLIGEDGLFVRDAAGARLVWCQKANAPRPLNDGDEGDDNALYPALFGEFDLPKALGGARAQTAMNAALAVYLDEQYAPENAAAVCGVPATTIRRLARELAVCAFDREVKIPTAWTDSNGNRHDSFVGRPVAMHAMRGISAHSNGFQTCRALHLLQALLGAIDAPGSHLARPPYPKNIGAHPKPAQQSAPNTPLARPPLGVPTDPADLVVDAAGEPLRIDKAFSWDAPLAAHGALHTVIANAAAADPYPIDTLMLFMANMAWNSSMNVDATIAHLRAKNDAGADDEYRIPFIVAIDAFHSETVNFADLVLPDTTYLERHDTISLLDRPISEAHAVCDAIRQPVVDREHDTRAWQEVLVDLAGRLQFPAFVGDDGAPKYRDYQDFITRYEKAAGVGFLAGWRGASGESHLRGAPNPRQWQRYIDNECFFRHELPPAMRYYRFANRDYLRFAAAAGWITSDRQIVLEIYSEALRKFQRAGEGVGERTPPREEQRDKLRAYFRPLPFYYPPLEHAQTDSAAYPFFAVTQRPMFMYHSWDSQNAWLRQIAAANVLYVNRARGEAMGLTDGDWVWLTSRAGKIAAPIKLMDGVAADTVWTYNAIGKLPGAWGLSADANENVEGFLLNHLIADFLPQGKRQSNSDPITGQAAWYDLKIDITPMTAIGGDDAATKIFRSPRHPIARAQDAASSSDAAPSTLRYASHRAVHFTRALRDVLLK